MYTYKDKNRKYYQYADGIPYIKNKNLFAGGSQMNPWTKLAIKDAGGEGWENNISEGYANILTDNYKNSKNSFGIAKKWNPFSKGNLQTGIGKGLMVGAANAVGGVAENLLSGGKSSGAGKTISNIGGTVGSAVGTFNPVAGAIITGASKIIGGFTNGMWGNNAADLAKYDSEMNKANSTKIGYGDTNSVMSQISSLPNIDSNIKRKSFGWANGSTYRNYVEGMNQATSFQDRSIGLAANNTTDAEIENYERNYAAEGGQLEMNTTINTSSPIGYSLMHDYMMTKQPAQNYTGQNAPTKSMFNTNLFSTKFADGGNMSTGDVIDISEEEYNRLKALGYEFEEQ